MAWKITNKTGLPSAFVNMAINDQYEKKPKHYSVTTLLSPILMTLLSQRYEVEVDVSDLIWMLFGTAVHSILEKHDKTGYSEIRMEVPIKGGYYFTGKFDLYNEKDFSIEDYKVTTAWKVLNEDFDDYKKQGLMYAWLLRKTQQKHVSKLKFHLLLKDWKKNDLLRFENYPEKPVWTWKYQIRESDFIEIEKFIKDRLSQLIYYENKPLNEIPICSLEERWNMGDKYAVMQNGNKRAKRVFDDKIEAEKYRIEKGYDYIEKRPGIDKRCEDYCEYNSVCPYWNKKNLHKQKKKGD